MRKAGRFKPARGLHGPGTALGTVKFDKKQALPVIDFRETESLAVHAFS